MNPEETQQNEEQELFEHYRIQADPGQSPLRIDKFLMTRIENATRTKIQQAAKSGNILVNDVAIKPNYKVKPHDVISVVLPTPPREVEIIPEDIPLEILYEDEYIMVVNKQAGLVVHPGYNNYTGTLLNALTGYIHRQTGKDPQECIPYLVHRIDKDTSGVLLISKDEYTQSLLARQFFDHSIERKYQAIVWGEPDPAEGTIEGHIGRSYKDRRVMDVFPDGEYGKHAITHYSTLENFHYVSLMECKLETGRTHQIRAHFKYKGHPLFNDVTYGGDKIIKGTTFSKYKQFITNCFKVMPRQGLHAKSLGFIHPHTNKEIYFETDLPEDMVNLLEKWRKYVSTQKQG